MREQDQQAFKEKVLKQFLNGEPLFGKDGAFAPILKEFLEEALQAEMEGHLADVKKGREVGNKRNGKKEKTVKSSHGEVTIETPQDRDSSFRPQIIEKRQRILADNLEKQIIAMYGMGNSLRDISSHIKETCLCRQAGVRHRHLHICPERHHRPDHPEDKGMAGTAAGARLLHRLAGCDALQGKGGRQGQAQGPLQHPGG